MNTNNNTHTLPAGFVLNNQYIIDSIMGEGGFGITYVGHIKESEPFLAIAIKEYFPSGVAGRGTLESPYEVTHFGGDFLKSFDKGLQRFFNEAILLKKYSYLDSIVTILDVFEENNTAYIIMEYIEGISLKQLITNEGVLSFEDIYELMKSVMNDISVIHEEGLIHRDISPDNLLVGIDNKLHLIDFGSASYSNPNETKTITVLIKAGYAPPEQYLPNGHIGPWTDVYGLCATMFYALTGKAPANALSRMQNKQEEALSFPDTANIDGQVKKALTRGLSLSYSDRFPSAKALCHALSAHAMPEEPVTLMMKESFTGKLIRKTGRFFKKNRLFITITATTICIAVSLIYRMISTNGGEQPDAPVIATPYTGTINTAGKIIDTSDNTSSVTPSAIATDNENNFIKNTDVPDNDNEKTMPALTGLSVEKATKILTGLDPNINILTKYKYDKSHAIGVVTAQDISPEYTFKAGELDNITLTISKGKRPKATAIPKATATPKTTSMPAITKKPKSTLKPTAKPTSKQKTAAPTKKPSDYTIIHLD